MATVIFKSPSLMNTFINNVRKVFYIYFLFPHSPQNVYVPTTTTRNFEKFQFLSVYFAFKMGSIPPAEVIIFPKRMNFTRILKVNFGRKGKR